MDEVQAVVSLVNNRVIRAIRPVLESENLPFRVFNWRRRAGHWAGVGVAEQVKTPQKVVNAATRAMLNNAGMSAGSQVVGIMDGLIPADGSNKITPDKLWWLDPKSAAGIDDVRKAFAAFEWPNKTPELMSIVEYGFKLFEEHSSIPLITQGQSGDTTPDTFSGQQLQDNNANQLLRDVGFQAQVVPGGAFVDAGLLLVQQAGLLVDGVGDAGVLPLGPGDRVGGGHAQSRVTLASLITFAHLRISAARNFSNSSGVLPTGSAPSLENRASTVDGLMQVGAHNVLIVMTGNDMLGAGTASDETTRLASYLDDRAVAAVTGGYILTRIVLSTLPRTTGGFNAKRNTANATKATWVGSHCEIFVNLDNCGIGQDADASNASYYADGVHPTDAGNALILAAVKPVIDALMPSLSGAPQTDLIEHWKLGYGLTQSGGKASSWKGRRQAFNLTQSTGTKQPAVQGDSSLLFDGTDDLLAALFAFEAAGATVCLLMKQPTWTNAKCIANLAVPPAANSLWKFGTTPDFITHTAANNGTQTAGLTLDTYGTVIFGISAASSILQVNAGTTTNDTGFTISGSKGSLILGALSDGSYHANVQIKEVLVYRGILDATARAAVRAYFATVP